MDFGGGIYENFMPAGNLILGMNLKISWETLGLAEIACVLFYYFLRIDGVVLISVRLYIYIYIYTLLAPVTLNLTSKIMLFATK
jgi:hypothetical protein